MKRTLLMFCALALTIGVFASCKGKEPEVKEITSVKVDPTAALLKPGETKQLKVEWTPAEVKVNATFTSNKPEIATVDAKGLVTAVKDGEAIITVNVGNKKATCNITVSDKTITEVKVEPTSVTLKATQTQKLNVTWTPAELPATPAFSSNKEAVATVNNEGVITAVAEGNAVITVTIGQLTATCDVKVEKGAAPAGESQLPLMKFKGPKDKEIAAYEAKVGRELKDKVLVAPKQGFKTQAYVGNLDLIPVACYGLSMGEYKAIAALGTESIEDCAATLDMLQKNGFENAQVMDIQGQKAIGGTCEVGDISITVMASDEPVTGENGQPDTKLFIRFLTENVATAEHATIPDVKDFPDVADFFGGAINADKIKAYEEKLGFREFDASQSKDNNFAFNTKEDRIDASNIFWTYYVGTPVNPPVFINSQVCSAASAADLAKPEVAAWLKANGFTIDEAKSQDGWYKAFTEDRKLGLQIFYSEKDKAVFMQIVEGSFLDKQSSAMQIRRAALRKENRGFKLPAMGDLKVSRR